MKLRPVLSALCAVLMLASAARAEDVLVFAAASTTNALDEIAVLFSAKGLGTV